MVRFSMVPGSPLEFRGLDSHSLLVRPKGDAKTIGQLSLVSPTMFEVGSTKGDLAVSIEGTDHVVAESTAYRVSMTDDANGGPTNPAGRRGAFWIWFPVAVVVAATTVGLVLAFMSPSHP
jgi:hypothetical protein